MAINRRQLLCGLAAAAVLPRVSMASATDAPRFITGFMDDGGEHAVGVMDGRGRLTSSMALPGRGHSMAVRPGSTEAVVFARRPGQFAAVFNWRNGNTGPAFETRAERHFYGHGVYSPDGRWLYAPENDFESSDGVIGVYDAAAGYRWEREIPSHGVGPHDTHLLDDGTTLVVANGGIATHPESGRTKLNLATMAPSLAYIDRASGALLEQHYLEPALHQLSIRHLAVHGDVVAFAMQFQGPRTQVVPLVGIHRRGAPVQLLHAPRRITRQMRNYCGSVSIDAGGSVVAVTCPRGGMSVFWDLATLEFLGHWALPDVSGIAPGRFPGSFVITAGGGEVAVVAVSPGLKALGNLPPAGKHWDNHLVGL